MFPLGDKPYLGYYLELLFNEGITEVIILVSYQGHKIKEYVEARPEFKAGKVKIIEQPEGYGPAGALCHIEDMLQERFFLLYCDILFKTDLKAVFNCLDTEFEACTLITKDEYKMWETMEITIDENANMVTNFHPDAFDHENGWMDIGQAYRKSGLETLKKIDPYNREALNKLAWSEFITNGRLTYFKVGPVLDIGTEKNYNTTNEIFGREGLKALDEVEPSSSPRR